MSKSKREFTVRDGIEITWIVRTVDEPNGVIWSPNRSKFLTLTRRGNVDTNCNVYALHLYEIDSDRNVNYLGEVNRFSSSSNRPAIKDVRWVNQNNITFIAENQGELPQVYIYNLNSCRIKVLTKETNIIEAYSYNHKCKTVLADVRASNTNEKVFTRGYVVGESLLKSILDPRGSTNPYGHRYLRLVKNGKTLNIELKSFLNFRNGPFKGLGISPNGQFGTVILKQVNYPDNWRDIYKGEFNNWNKVAAYNADDHLGIGEPPDTMGQVCLIDMSSGDIVPAVDAPIALACGVTFRLNWSPDSNSLAFGPNYPPEYTKKRALPAFIGLSLIDDRHVEIIASVNEKNDGNKLTWSVDPKKKISAIKHGDGSSKKKVGEWKFIDVDHSGVGIDVGIIESLNTAPEIAVRNCNGDISTISMFNDRLENVEISILTPIKWTDKFGDIWTGGLILPPDHREGQRVPLVIYTHGFDPDTFWVTGPYNAGFGYAGRALASRGVAVLDVSDRKFGRYTKTEVARQVEGYRSAVQHLSSIGIIDINNVGIHAWSRTGYYLLDALLENDFTYRAASVADADVLSRQHLTDFYMIPGRGMSDVETLIGAKFWGRKGVKRWNKREPIMRLCEVRTPLRIETTAWLPAWWDVYALLRRYGRAVEYVFYPDGYHVLVKPWEQQTSQEGAIDWYVFWLLGLEDPAPSKASQYARWRSMAHNSSSLA